MTALVTACAGEATDDTATVRFVVASSAPEQGDVNVTVAQAPEFRLNAPADPETCNTSNLLLVGMDESGEFAFDVNHTVVFQDEGNKLLLTHSEPLLRGYWYAAMSINSATPCTNLDGLPLEPYGIEFYVP
jgi:hypothetical protein